MKITFPILRFIVKPGAQADADPARLQLACVTTQRLACVDSWSATHSLRQRYFSEQTEKTTSQSCSLEKQRVPTRKPKKRIEMGSQLHSSMVVKKQLNSTCRACRITHSFENNNLSNCSSCKNLLATKGWSVAAKETFRRKKWEDPLFR